MGAEERVFPPVESSRLDIRTTTRRQSNPIHQPWLRIQFQSLPTDYIANPQAPNHPHHEQTSRPQTPLPTEALSRQYPLILRTTMREINPLPPPAGHCTP